MKEPLGIEGNHVLAHHSFVGAPSSGKPEPKKKFDLGPLVWSQDVLDASSNPLLQEAAKKWYFQG